MVVTLREHPDVGTGWTVPGTFLERRSFEEQVTQRRDTLVRFQVAVLQPSRVRLVAHLCVAETGNLMTGTRIDMRIKLLHTHAVLL